jgi:hypothetical protein
MDSSSSSYYDSEYDEEDEEIKVDEESSPKSASKVE